VKRYRFALGPGWVLFHLFAFACAISMVFLGRWQLLVSESKHFNLQNFGYSIQWWLFAAFTLFFWSRVLRDAARRRDNPSGGAASPTPAEPAPHATAHVAYRRYVMPTASQRVDDDPVHGAYNDYLAGLAAKDAEEQ
jgi:DNA-binding transcriptional regulator of glucitol operon